MKVIAEITFDIPVKEYMKYLMKVLEDMEILTDIKIEKIEVKPGLDNE